MLRLLLLLAIATPAYAGSSVADAACAGMSSSKSKGFCHAYFKDDDQCSSVKGDEWKTLCKGYANGSGACSGLEVEVRKFCLALAKRTYSSCRGIQIRDMREACEAVIKGRDSECSSVGGTDLRRRCDKVAEGIQVAMTGTERVIQGIFDKASVTAFVTDPAYWQGIIQAASVENQVGFLVALANDATDTQIYDAYRAHLNVGTAILTDLDAQHTAGAPIDWSRAKRATEFLVKQNIDSMATNLTVRSYVEANLEKLVD